MGDKSLDINNKNKNKIYISHSVLKIGKTKVMLAENSMDTNEKYKVGNNISLCIQSADLEEIQQFYNSSITDKIVRIILPLEKIYLVKLMASFKVHSEFKSN